MKQSKVFVCAFSEGSDDHFVWSCFSLSDGNELIMMQCRHCRATPFTCYSRSKATLERIRHIHRISCPQLGTAETLP